MIATYPLRRDLWQELFEKLTDSDVEEFNLAHGLAYTRKEFAYVAPTVMLIDELLTHHYGREIPFRTRFLKVTWGAEYVLVQVEVIYQPVIIWN